MSGSSAVIRRARLAKRRPQTGVLYVREDSTSLIYARRQQVMEVLLQPS